MEEEEGRKAQMRKNGFVVDVHMRIANFDCSGFVQSLRGFG
jgi:hypothetical protein